MPALDHMLLHPHPLDHLLAGHVPTGHRRLGPGDRSQLSRQEMDLYGRFVVLNEPQQSWGMMLHINVDLKKFVLSICILYPILCILYPVF